MASVREDRHLEDDRGRTLREAMRRLLLPIPAGGEVTALEATKAAFDKQGVDVEDAPLWLQVGMEDWRVSGAPDSGFAAIVESYIGAARDAHAKALAASYFDLHARLRDQPRFDHHAASTLLSHARLMVRLASDEMLSASQIAKLIAARDHRVPISWIQVQMVLKAVALAPTLSISAVQDIYESDRTLEVSLFADADEQVCAEMVAAIATQLGFTGNILEALTTLLPSDKAPFGPYLQILHYQCSIAECYDHALSSIYEFTPRGKAPKWLFGRYPASLEVAKENPFLNNAKGVDELNDAWARSRNDQESTALVGVIQGLDSMGYAARRELAAWLRRLLVRTIRLAEDDLISLPNRLDKRQAQGLFEHIAVEETHTRGIVEQRVVDAVARLRHPSPQWIPRGLLDSVNATNISRLKCGDCDFQDGGAYVVHAYEAHGGKLTEIYLEGHLRSLEAILPLRVKEWEENFGPGNPWQLRVTFVAHEQSGRRPIEREIGGVSVTVATESFDEFLAGVDPADAAVLESLDTYVRAPLGEPRTPNSIRRTFLELVQPTS